MRGHITCSTNLGLICRQVLQMIWTTAFTYIISRTKIIRPTPNVLLSNLFYRKKVYKKYVYMLFVASNASDWWMTTFTPSSSDQMIRNLSMKIGEVNSGSARLLWLLSFGHRLEIQCVLGSTAIVWHPFSPLHVDISKNPFGNLMGTCVDLV